MSVAGTVLLLLLAGSFPVGLASVLALLSVDASCCFCAPSASESVLLLLPRSE